ncbi:hypothetical protein C8R45DRAFT_935017 [Mycena sanguinolenta]|nr:hypothetical protein C8R45DRAFT_935017 [Mycena sanguinolenta]
MQNEYDAMHMQNGNFPLPAGGFPGLRALWGDAFPSLLPTRAGSYWGPPTGPPFVGPIVDTMSAAFVETIERAKAGKPPFAHNYCEIESPNTISAWWPQAITLLYREASKEEQAIKGCFARMFPYHPVVHPDRANRTPKFLFANARLNAVLDSFLPEMPHPRRCHRERCSLGRLPGSTNVELRLKRRRRRLWHTPSPPCECSETDVELWGTADDPRNLSPIPVVSGGWGSTMPWGAGGAWGTGTWGTGTWGGEVEVAANAVHKRFHRSRWFPGNSYMGVVCAPRRVKPRSRRTFRWLRTLDSRWRRQERALLALAAVREMSLKLAYSLYSV